MSDLESEFRQLIQQEANIDSEYQEIRDEEELDLRSVINAAHFFGVAVPEGVDLSNITLDEVERLFREDDTPEDIAKFMTTLITATTAILCARLDDHDELMANAQSLIAYKHLGPTEKVKWAKVIETTTGDIIISSPDGNEKAELEAVARITDEIEAKNLEVEHNELIRLIIKDSLNEVITDLYGSHDDQTILVTSILKCAEIAITTTPDNFELSKSQISWLRGTILNIAKKRGITEPSVDMLIEATVKIFQSHGYQKI